MTNWNLVDAEVDRWSKLGAIGVSIQTLDGQAWGRDAERPFVAASTIKIPVMIELFRRIDAGDIRLEQLLRIGEARVPGSGVLQHLRPELEVTVEEACILMIAISDNAATNLLVDLVGLDAVNRTIASLGMARSRMGRKMLGRRATSADGENWVTAADLNRAVLAILNGSAASHDACKRMKAMLQKQDGCRRVTRHAPEGSVWGSKPGSLPGIVNDAGFIETNHGTIVVSVCTEGIPDDLDAEKAIGDIALAGMRAVGMMP